jgi:(p)ppGpp synthase/HD superfamily hydrolase
VAAGILHDSVEDSPATIHTIKATFGFAIPLQ